LKEDLAIKNQIINEEEVILNSIKNPENFKVLYAHYFKQIFLFILHRVGDKALTGDLTSQVFLKALTNLKKYQPRGFPFSAWLYRIAVNECNDFFRKTKRARVVVLEDFHTERFYEEMVEQDPLEDIKRLLPRVLEKLKYDELQLIELRFMENRPFLEVANILGITENYAKVRTYRILAKMKKYFQESGQ
jgi:RNA polymerase sigma-70 factor (ECF subfamily)